MASSMDSLNRLPIFVQAAEAKGFTKAARRLGISPAAVSKAISQLEESLGVRLFERTTRSVTLTDDGTAYYERCRQALADIEEAETALSRNRSTPAGKLHVSLQVALGRLHIVPAIPAFAERYPELKIQVDLNDRWVDLIGEGVDVAVRLGGQADTRLIEHQIRGTRGILCASPAYLQRCGEPQSPQDLTQHNVYVYSGYPGPPFPLPFERDDERVEVPVAGNLTANNAEALVELALAGYGISGVMSFIASSAIRRGALKHILPDWNIPLAPPISIIYPKHRHLSAKVRAFVDFVTDLLGPEIET